MLNNHTLKELNILIFQFNNNKLIKDMFTTFNNQAKKEDQLKIIHMSMIIMKDIKELQD